DPSPRRLGPPEARARLRAPVKRSGALTRPSIAVSPEPCRAAPGPARALRETPDAGVRRGLGCSRLARAQADFSKVEFRCRSAADRVPAPQISAVGRLGQIGSTD